MKLKSFILIALLYNFFILQAEIKLSNILTDNMVLQQNAQVAIWGWSDPGETVKIITSWNTKDTIKVLNTNQKPKSLLSLPFFKNKSN